MALSVDPGDTVNFLLEIGALDSQDMAIVRRAREALGPTYDRAGDRKDWEQVHTIGILQHALVTPDSVAYLAYHTRGFQSSERQQTTSRRPWLSSGCAADTLGVAHHRPWKIQDDDLSLPHWREQIWRLLLDMPGNTLPRPPTSTLGPHDCDAILAVSTPPLSPRQPPWRKTMITYTLSRIERFLREALAQPTVPQVTLSRTHFVIHVDHVPFLLPSTAKQKQRWSVDMYGESVQIPHCIASLYIYNNTQALVLAKTGSGSDDDLHCSDQARSHPFSNRNLLTTVCLY